MRNMGPLENIIAMIPGMNKIKDVDIDERNMVKVEASSTPYQEERKDHNLASTDRGGRGIALEAAPPLRRQQGRQAVCRDKKMLKMFKGKKGFKLPKLCRFKLFLRLAV